MNESPRIGFFACAGLAILAFVIPEWPAVGANAPSQIPFRLEQHNIVVDAEVRGHHIALAFDSGLSPGVIVTPAAAAALDLKGERDIGVNDAGGVRRKAALTRLDRIKLGDIVLVDVPLAVTEIPAKVLSRPDDTQLAGYIGAPLIENSVLCVSYEKKELVRWSRAEFDGARAGLVSVPMQINHGLPVITAKIDGLKATLIVDTGNAGGVVVYETFAQRNKFPQRYRNFSPKTANGGSGQTLMTMSGEADELDIGPDTSFEHAPMDVIPQGMDPAWAIDGMLGRQLLEQLNPCLDREGGRLWFTPE